MIEYYDRGRKLGFDYGDKTYFEYGKLHYGLILNLPISIHKYYVNGDMKKGVTKEGTSYNNYIKNIKFSLNLEVFEDKKTFIMVEYYYPNNYYNDIDNPLKCLFDSFSKAGIIADDRFFKNTYIEKYNKDDIEEEFGIKQPNNFKGYCYVELMEYTKFKKNVRFNIK